MDSLQLTFSSLQIPETKQEVVSEADGDGFFQGDANVIPPASSNDAKPFPSDIWPQQGETGTKAIVLAPLSAEGGWRNSSSVQIKIPQTTFLFPVSPAFPDLAGSCFRFVFIFALD